MKPSPVAHCLEPTPLSRPPLTPEPSLSSASSPRLFFRSPSSYSAKGSIPNNCVPRMLLSRLEEGGPTEEATSRSALDLACCRKPPHKPLPTTFPDRFPRPQPLRTPFFRGRSHCPPNCMIRVECISPKVRCIALSLLNPIPLENEFTLRNKPFFFFLPPSWLGSLQYFLAFVMPPPRSFSEVKVSLTFPSPGAGDGPSPDQHVPPRTPDRL